MKLNILVLYDGAGLARLGLEQSGHTCTGVELHPIKHEMSQFVGSGNSILGDVLDLPDSFYEPFDAIWSSPPCQSYSDQKTDDKIGEYGNPECLPHSLELMERFPDKIIWIENVVSNYFKQYGTHYNAAQFLQVPLQRRRRLIAGNYKAPYVYRDFKYDYKELQHVPPAVLAQEIGFGGLHKNQQNERRKFTRWYLRHMNRKPNVLDMATSQGFIIPDEWVDFSEKQISQVIGNGVPTYMSKAFGDAYSQNKVAKQTNFFNLVEARYG